MFIRAQRIARVLLYGFIIICDMVLLTLADILAFYTCLGPDFAQTNNFMDYLRIFPFVICLKIGSFYIFQLYSKPKYKSNFITTILIIKATFVSMLIAALTAYFLRADSIPRAVVALSWIFSICLVLTWRTIGKYIIEVFIGYDYFKSYIVVIGSDEDAERTAVHFMNDATINYKLIGFIRYQDEPHERPGLRAPIIGSFDQIENILKQYQVDEIVVASHHVTRKDLGRLYASISQDRTMLLHITPGLYEGLISSATLCQKDVSVAPLTSGSGIPIWYPPIKRILDVILSCLILIIASPVILVIALAIKLTSPGPVLYMTKRVGYMGRVFIMYKFRSMYHASEGKRIEHWAKRHDTRITPIGSFLRRFRIDELPQLVNVIKNDMSLIGPRPESRYYVSKLLKEIPMYSERFKIKPGITGWAQVSYGYAASFEESREKLFYDVFYIQNQSFALDVLITFKTARTIIRGTGV